MPITQNLARNLLLGLSAITGDEESYCSTAYYTHEMEEYRENEPDAVNPALAILKGSGVGDDIVLDGVWGPVAQTAYERLLAIANIPEEDLLEVDDDTDDE